MFFILTSGALRIPSFRYPTKTKETKMDIVFNFDQIPFNVRHQFAYWKNKSAFILIDRTYFKKKILNDIEHNWGAWNWRCTRAGGGGGKPHM